MTHASIENEFALDVDIEKDIPCEHSQHLTHPNEGLHAEWRVWIKATCTVAKPRVMLWCDYCKTFVLNAPWLFCSPCNAVGIQHWVYPSEVYTRIERL